MAFKPIVRSQITFLYYEALPPAADFYGRIMGFELVEDQGWAKIYRSGGNAFVGIVDGERGYHRPQEKNAAMLTLVVDDVPAWEAHLRRQGVKILTPATVSTEIQAEYCFCQDPGGYVIELERFLKPELAAVFGLQPVSDKDSDS